MATYGYEIGLAVESRTNIEVLAGVAPSPESTLPRYPLFRITGTGAEEEDGFLQCTWHFDYISLAGLEAVRTLITGQSSVVHIRTKEDDGTYGCYQCYAHRPKIPGEGARLMGGFRDVTLRFTHMMSEECS